MDLWAILGELKKLLFWAFAKVWQLLNWLFITTEPYLGSAGALFLVFAIIFFPAVIIVMRSIAKTQAGIESFGASILTISLKVFAVFLMTMLILFVLSSV